MKILLLARYLPAEGSTTHMYTLAKELISRGHEVAIASAGPDESKAAEAIFKNTVSDGVVHLKMPFPLNPSFSRWGKLHQALIYVAGAPLSLFRIARWNPDVIHVHYPVTSFIAQLYKRLTNVKFVMTYHIAGIPKHPLHCRGDRAIAISNDLRKEIINDFAYHPDVVQLVHNGIELSRFATLNQSEKSADLKRLGLESVSKKTIVGFIGTVSHRKGLDVLLEALRQLEKNQFHLVVVGDGDREWLQSLIQENQLTDNVSIFPFSEPENFYSIFDVFVLPSRKEGFPLVPLEAMASGVLTIRSAVEGATDQITDGITGFLFDCEDSLQLSSLLQGILRGAYDTEAISFAGRRKVIESFGVGQMIDQIENIYQDLVEQ